MKTVIKKGDIFCFPDGYVENQVRYIYGLIDPRDVQQVRYVGIARHPFVRLGQHCAAGSRFGHESFYPLSLAHWVGGLVREGVLPVVKVLEVTLVNEALVKEREWICRLQDKGQRLLNADFKSRRYRGDDVRRPRRNPLVKELKRQGEWLKQLRLQQGWTQQDVADYVGFRYSSISKWESGERGIPEYVMEQLKGMMSRPKK
jgi:DNA-binding XRE family transcriptional regulator